MRWWRGITSRRSWCEREGLELERRSVEIYYETRREQQLRVCYAHDHPLHHLMFRTLTASDRNRSKFITCLLRKDNLKQVRVRHLA